MRKMVIILLLFQHKLASQVLAPDRKLRRPHRLGPETRPLRLGPCQLSWVPDPKVSKYSTPGPEPAVASPGHNTSNATRPRDHPARTAPPRAALVTGNPVFQLPAKARLRPDGLQHIDRYQPPRHDLR
ncbi:hypothetical protein BO78DRAFT_110142 [Aspergillus sclerotiicarbonarius CBS 121057]|uniref:Secreted protein n=1 Tax=Aspergillus sclerotiicarbonarius (strain CBS 121057 / IBT 28362) TaxID=1448318 RepID=A0A319ESG9_ASPSB|nr:hypothetical protein BO78DRAFT_110142 [Aspergillus sclerotiicarbonarius CBS 121057]